jgi:hypothetical protein
VDLALERGHPQQAVGKNEQHPMSCLSNPVEDFFGESGPSAVWKNAVAEGSDGYRLLVPTAVAAGTLVPSYRMVGVEEGGREGRVPPVVLFQRAELGLEKATTAE